MEKMSGGCCPDVKGSEGFSGRNVGGYDSHVHGKDSKPNNFGSNLNHKPAFVGEKKVSGVGGKLHAKHYAHMK